MLSAFHARVAVELKAQDKSKIECVLAYGDRLLVGLNTGTLRVYRVNESAPDPDEASGRSLPETSTVERGANAKAKTVELLREVEKFSRRPVVQLARIKEVNLLVALTDGYVSFYDLQNYDLSERLEQTRGASMFAVISDIVSDPNSGIMAIVSKLAVAVKRKILVWSWHDTERSEKPSEITLPATIKSLMWSKGSNIVVGMDPGYALVDVVTGDVSDINKPASTGEAAGAAGARFGAVNASGMSYVGMGSWVPKPMSTKLSSSLILLAKDVNSLFIDDMGQALDKRQVPWHQAPDAIAYSYPYLLALYTGAKGTLDIRNPDTLSLLQSIPLPNAQTIHVPDPTISLAHAGKGFLVANDRCIWRMGALSYNSQIEELLAQHLYDEAISLYSQLEDTLIDDKERRLRDVRIQKATYLFEQRLYRDALELFTDAPAAPATVIALYPKVVAGSLSRFGSDGEQADDGDVFSTSKESSSILKSPPTSPPKRSSTWWNRGENDVNPPETPSPTEGSPSRGRKGGSTESDRRLEGRDLIVAVKSLHGFLAQTRSQLQKYINYDGTLKEQLSLPIGDTPPFANFIELPDGAKDVDWAVELYNTAVLVDTTLFRAYMLTTPTLAGSLFRIDNFCDPVVVKDKLYETGRYVDLIDFLHGKKLHKEALELLEKFGKQEADDDVAEQLRGPRRTVAYLQQLPFELIDVILKYAQWPIEEDPELGMQVFLADSENAETLPRDRVLEFLQGINYQLAVQYLEHTIEELNDETPEFHERLIGLYLDRLKAGDALNGTKEYLQRSIKEWQTKLERILISSKEYSRAKILEDLPADDDKFFESRAVVLSKLGRHKAALQIYVFQMKDYSRAEEYCNSIYLAQTPSSTDPDETSPAQSIYTSLLSLYLTPPNKEGVNLAAALDLLSRHGSRLPTLNTIDLLPSSINVGDLESYFRGRMRAANTLRREQAILAALNSVEKSRWEAALLLGEDVEDMATALAGRSRRVILGEDRLCSVCHKRFGRAVIKTWPDGDVTHYACADRRRPQGHARTTLSRAVENDASYA